MGPRLLTLPLIAVLSLGVVIAAHGDDKKPADAPRGLKFTGRVQADALSGLSARVAGAVDKVDADEGDRVKKGQVLIELSAPELKDDLDAVAARLDQAKAEVEQAEGATQAAKARLAQTDAALEAGRAAVRRSKAAAAQAQAEADRFRRLGDSEAHVVSREEIDEHLHNAEAARASVEEAEAQMKTAEAARDVAAAELAKAEAGVKATQAGVAVAQAGVRRAETRLGFTRIVAPFDGVVARRTVDVGATVGPPRQGESAPLISVMRDDVVHVAFDVDERDISRVRAGALAVVRIPSLADMEVKGKVTRLAGAVNRDTGTISVQMDLPNPDGKLRPGMFVTVEVKADQPGK